MTRLNIVVEGFTEETFVSEVLYPHLAQFRVFAIPRLVFSSRNEGRVYRGGVSTYQKMHMDIALWCKQDPRAFVTSFFDLYALPPDFPSRQKAAKESDIYLKIATLETAFKDSIKMRNFIPYIQLHEYEALILSEPAKLESFYPFHGEAIQILIDDIASFSTPEHVDEDKQKAPSKRILKHIPGYNKHLAGALVAMEIGLEKIRSRCRHFDEWVKTLENLGN